MLDAELLLNQTVTVRVGDAGDENSSAQMRIYMGSSLLNWEQCAATSFLASDSDRSDREIRLSDGEEMHPCLQNNKQSLLSKNR